MVALVDLDRTAVRVQDHQGSEFVRPSCSARSQRASLSSRSRRTNFTEAADEPIGERPVRFSSTASTSKPSLALSTSFSKTGRTHEGNFTSPGNAEVAGRIQLTPLVLSALGG